MSSNALPIWGAQAGQTLKLDCRHYRGDRPCSAGIQGVCPSDCASYARMGHRIAIIKLGALGDVIRTAALLPGLKTQWPESQITWITRPSGVRMLANHPLIDRLLPFDAETLCHIEHERFDLCLSLDKEPGPTALAMRLDARERRGVGLSSHGTVYPLNEACSDYFRLGLDDHYKFQVNTSSYQALLYTAVGLPYAGERYRLYPGEAERKAADRFWAEHGVDGDRRVIGMNTGAGQVFANKIWSREQFKQVIQRIQSRSECAVALFGGPDEHERNAWLAEQCPGVINTGTNHSEPAFAALLARCHALLSGDTMAMHVAIAFEVPVVALFGPTCEQEIDLFGRGEKVCTSLGCAPCYRRTCDVSPNCMEVLDVERVVDALLHWGADSHSNRLPVLEASMR
jgi:ADP-heptose:LPS heptosyltransferase